MMMTKNKTINAFEAAYAEAVELNPSGAGQAVAECAKKLRRVAARAKDKSDDSEWSREHVRQSRGPAIEFSGKLLGQYSGEAPGKSRWQEGEVWITRGGAYVAILSGLSDTGGEEDFVAVTVIEPGDDEDERRIAVMDAMGWSGGARQMATKQLKWQLLREIA